VAKIHLQCHTLCILSGTWKHTKLAYAQFSEVTFSFFHLQFSGKNRAYFSSETATFIEFCILLEVLSHTLCCHLQWLATSVNMLQILELSSLSSYTSQTTFKAFYIIAGFLCEQKKCSMIKPLQTHSLQSVAP
jgi:hypothetical protein